jgi:hypothetical protein
MRFAACSFGLSRKVKATYNLEQRSMYVANFGLSRKVKATYNLEQRSMYVANFSPGGFEQV